MCSKILIYAFSFCTLFWHLNCALVKYNNNVANRLSVAPVEWDKYDEKDVQGPQTYAFGYDIEDPQNEQTQFRQEERLPNGTTIGSYGYLSPDGTRHIVNYIADENGYRAQVETLKKRPVGDVKPIPVDIDQDLDDAISSIQNHNHHNYNKKQTKYPSPFASAIKAPVVPPVRENYPVNYNPYNYNQNSKKKFQFNNQQLYNYNFRV